jgi:hypothetical protein
MRDKQPIKITLTRTRIGYQVTKLVNAVIIPHDSISKRKFSFGDEITVGKILTGAEAQDVADGEFTQRQVEVTVVGK